MLNAFDINNWKRIDKISVEFTLEDEERGFILNIKENFVPEFRSDAFKEFFEEFGVKEIELFVIKLCTKLKRFNVYEIKVIQGFYLRISFK